MKSILNWTGGMVFQAESDGHQVLMDAKAPIGKNTAMTPKEMVLAGLAGCTAMDVIALMKKHKQDVKTFQVSVEAPTTTGQMPAVFTEAQITFELTGTIDHDKALEAVQLSQTKYCGVSKMLSQAFPIHYSVLVNGENIGTGETKF